MRNLINQKIETILQSKNEISVFRFIYTHETVTRADISKRLQLSPATVTNLIDTLIKKNVVLEGGVIKADRGRNSKVLYINNKKFRSIGIGINRFNVNAKCSDLDGNVYSTKKAELNTDSWAENYQTVLDFIDEILRENADYEKDIIGIGISIPTFIQYNMENLDCKYNFKDEWNIDTLTNLIEEKYKIGVVSSSSFSSILSGEEYFGAAKNKKNAIYINVSSAGLGWAKITNGRIDTIVSDNYKSIGNMIININASDWNENGSGSLQYYIGKDAIESDYQKLVLNSTGENDINQSIDYHKILELGEKGEYLAVQSISKAASILGVALANVSTVINPDIIILSGRIIKESTLFYDVVKKITNTRLKVLTGKKIEIGQCIVHNDTSSLGASTLVFESLFYSDIIG